MKFKVHEGSHENGNRCNMVHKMKFCISRVHEGSHENGNRCNMVHVLPI